MAEQITARPEWQQRVFQERAELDVKRAKLTAFLALDTAGPIDAHLLNRQLNAMTEYSDILGDRIARFE